MILTFWNINKLFYYLHTSVISLVFNRKKKPESRLKKMQSVSGKTENCRNNKKRKRGSSEKRFTSTQLPRKETSELLCTG